MLPTKTDIPVPGLKWLQWHSRNNVYHPGVDFGIMGSSDFGQDIIATKHGFVEYVSPKPSRWNGQNGGWGWFVIVKHDDGNYTRNAHCKDIVVKIGQEVKATDVIAHLGNTGASTGPHDHFEVFGEVMAKIQRKHWRRKWGYYPSGKSIIWIKNYYINPWEWLEKNENIPEWAKDDWAWAVRLGFAPKDPFIKKSTRQLLREAGIIKSKDEPVPAYEVISALRKFVKKVNEE